MTTAEVIPNGSLLDLSRRGYLEHAGVLAKHEAAHAVVAMFVGLGIEFASIDGAARDGGGRVQLDHRTSPGYGHLVTIMAGPIGHGEPVKWRPLAVGHGDEANLAALVEYLALDEDGYRDAERETRILLELPQVARAWRAISGALYEHGTLTGSQLRRLFDGHAIEPADAC